jgi:hypothetical protein
MSSRRIGLIANVSKPRTGDIAPLLVQAFEARNLEVVPDEQTGETRGHERFSARRNWRSVANSSLPWAATVPFSRHSAIFVRLLHRSLGSTSAR